MAKVRAEEKRLEAKASRGSKLSKAERKALAELGITAPQLAGLRQQQHNAKVLAARSADPGDPQHIARPRRGGVVAPDTTDTYRLGQDFLGVLSNPDPRISDPDTQARDRRSYAGPYSQYEEQLDKDAHLAACWAQRTLTLMGKPRSYQAADDSAPALDIAGFIEAALEKRRGWQQALLHWAMGRYYGFAAAEHPWPVGLATETLRYSRRIAGEKRSLSESAEREVLLPEYFEGRHPRRFRFGTERELRLLTQKDMLKGEEVPPFQFTVHTPDPRFGTPYGAGLARNSWWWSKFKSDGVKWLLVFAEKYASPTVIGQYPKGSSPGEREAVERVCTSLQQETGLAVPEGTVIELLEMANKAGTAGAYELICDYCDRQITKLVLGQTLTLEQGDTGARAMAEVHERIFNDIIRADAQALADTINRELIPMLVQINFGAQALSLCPSLVFEVDEADVNAAVEKFTKLKGAFPELEFSLSQIRRECLLDIPEDEEDTLKSAPPEPLGPDGLPIDTNTPSGGEKQTPKGGGNKASASGDAGRVPALRLSAPVVIHIHAAAEQIPDDELRKLLAEGIKAMAAISGQIPELVRAALLAYASQLLGPDAASQPIPPGLRDLASQYTLPDELRDALVERLNDDMTIGSVLGQGKLADALEAAGLELPIPDGNLKPLPEASNPLWKELTGEERFIPRRALQAFQQRAATVLEHDEFYRLDALSRASSFTAWDIAEREIAGIAGYIEDAIRDGKTVAQFADDIFEELRARYVVQGQELHAWHVQTIYNTNLATAYNQGQADALWAQREQLDHFRVINPDPQHPRCVATAGKVYPTTLLAVLGCPPWHFNCGSSIAAMHGNGGRPVETGPPLDETGREILPEVYPGPRDPATNQRIGQGAPFGAWAPPEQRAAHIQQQLQELRHGI